MKKIREFDKEKFFSSLISQNLKLFPKLNHHLTLHLNIHAAIFI